MTDTKLKTYEGNCHCGAIKFSVALPPLESAPPASCPCSICTKKGYLFLFPPKSALAVTKGGGTDGLGGGVLAAYTVDDKQAEHRFCATCAMPFGIVRLGAAPDSSVALNARMLQGVDLWVLGDSEVPALHAAGAYAPPAFPGLEALAAVPLPAGEKLYPGSCHCGAVTFALTSPWLLDDAGPADTENNSVAECDCSTCIRHAGFYTYPRPASRVAVAAAPPDALATYFSAQGNGFGGTQFCRVCGCVLFQHIVGPPAARVAALPPHVQARIRDKCDVRPVQVRALDFVLGRTEGERAEWARVRATVKRERASAEGKAYVVPE
ncbi:hypothetical protein B0H15DRAFT_406282 [Mycena belliarum]|uniref:CENP-V/GFA domain-containing protein n=1 Tax=Mycena belliarum TaxID=1033014 RepID=A0AAD6U0U0_9AGAR|nr:hypothetical protein B0H15DRAFT_406282 [Mycena belliae]